MQIVKLCVYIVTGVSILKVIIDFFDYRIFTGSTFSEFIYSSINAIGTAGIAYIVALFLRHISKTKSPFTKKSIRYISALGIWVMTYNIGFPLLASAIVNAYEHVPFAIPNTFE